MGEARRNQMQDLGGLSTAPPPLADHPAEIRGSGSGFTGQQLGNEWLARVKARMLLHFEVVLVLVLLGSVLFIDFFVVHRYAFLLFYFIPVLLAGFYLGTRQAMFTALLATGFVVYTTLVHDTGRVTPNAESSVWNLVIWSSFLILTGAIVGRLQEKNRAQVVQLQGAYLGIITILTKYLESADTYTRTHSKRVATISTELARRLGLSPEHVHNIWIAGLLHDMGKVEVIELIRRAAGLDPDEKAEVDDHTQHGARLLPTAGTVLQGAIPILLDHHRRYDDGREAIPIGARILAVANAYDEIVGDRPYRAGQAMETLQDGAGTQFDPQAVATLDDAKEQVLTVYEAA